jgi:antitoxin HigA-1
MMLPSWIITNLITQSGKVLKEEKQMTQRRPTPPGEMLAEEFMKPNHITQRQLAEHLGWPVTRVSQIITGKRVITAESALCLADAFNNDPSIWLNLQKRWDLWHAALQHQRRQPLELAS